MFLVTPLLVVMSLTGAAEGAAAQPAAQVESAAPGTPFKFGTHIFGRYENRDGYDRLGVSRGRFSEGNFTVYRTRLYVTSSPIDIGNGLKTEFRFAPQAAGFFGNLPNTISTAQVGLYEGWLSVSGSGWRVDAGRLRLDYGDALYVGDLDWNQVGRSFDGFVARFDVGPTGWIDFIGTQLADGINGPDEDPFAGDVFLTGFYGNIGSLVDETLTLEPYILTQLWGQQRLNAGTTTPRTAEFIVGVRTKKKFGEIDVRFEPGVQLGQRLVGTQSADVFAYQADLEVGMAVAEGIRVSIEGLIASGDDPDTEENEGWADPFSTPHKWLGLMDVIGLRTNVASAVAHARFTSGRFKAMIDAHAFWRPETFDGQSSYAGSEIDLQAVYTLGTGMSIRGLYAAFLPGSDHFFVGGQAADDVAHYVELQWTYALGHGRRTR